VPKSCAERQRATSAQEQGWVGSHAFDIVLGDSCRKPDGSVDTAACRPLDCFASYKVAVNDFISVGGSGFVVLKRNTTRFNTGISLRDALADYIRTLSLDPQYRCSGSDPQWGNIKGKSPTGLFDYSNVTCLLPAAGAHDGRIRPSVR
jgi:hypothetical protein